MRFKLTMKFKLEGLTDKDLNHLSKPENLTTRLKVRIKFLKKTKNIVVQLIF